MKTALTSLAVVLTLGLASLDSDAARRFGGGGNLGKQRAAPTARESTPATPAATPATPAAAPAGASAAAAKPAAPAAQPSFMQRWGGLLAGLGIGALLASLFGAQMGPIVGFILMALLAIIVIGFLMRLFASRGGAAARSAQYAATPPVGMVDSGPTPSGPAPSGPVVRLQPAAGVSAAAAPRPAMSQDEVQPFLRVAKTSFIRLQAANDAKDLDDIRDYTTPEMYAEISMQLQDRGDAPQKTEVVSVDAQLLENVVEGDYALASVRFTGLIRENDANNPEPFDEIWNVRKSLRERNGSWLISGIQQAA